MTDKLRFSPTFNENVEIPIASADAEENYEPSIWNSWPVVVKARIQLLYIIKKARARAKLAQRARRPRSTKKPRPGPNWPKGPQGPDQQKMPDQGQIIKANFHHFLNLGCLQ